MIRTLFALLACLSLCQSSSASNSSLAGLALRNDKAYEEERAVSVGRFFCPSHPEWFTEWRNTVLRTKGLFAPTNPLVFKTIHIHETLVPLVFPNRAVELIKDVFPSEDVAGVSNTARALIRAIYTIHIYRDLFGPLPRYRRHDIYHLYPQVDASPTGDRLKVSRILSFMFIIPRVTPVWESWKNLATLYGVSSPVELARMVASVAAGHKLAWFEEIF